MHASPCKPCSCFGCLHACFSVRKYSVGTDNLPVDRCCCERYHCLQWTSYMGDYSNSDLIACKCFFLLVFDRPLSIYFVVVGVWLIDELWTKAASAGRYDCEALCICGHQYGTFIRNIFRIPGVMCSGNCALITNLELSCLLTLHHERGYISKKSKKVWLWWFSPLKCFIIHFIILKQMFILNKRIFSRVLF